MAKKKGGKGIYLFIGILSGIALAFLSMVPSMIIVLFLEAHLYGDFTWVASTAIPLVVFAVTIGFFYQLGERKEGNNNKQTETEVLNK